MHTCALQEDGTVRCWGTSTFGQLGFSGRLPMADPGWNSGGVFLDATSSNRALQISSNSFHSCALLEDGQVRCWGMGFKGRLGYGDDRDVLQPSSRDHGVDLDGRGSRAIQVAAGLEHTCAILEDFTVRCWGSN